MTETNTPSISCTPLFPSLSGKPCYRYRGQGETILSRTPHVFPCIRLGWFVQLKSTSWSCWTSSTWSVLWYYVSLTDGSPPCFMEIKRIHLSTVAIHTQGLNFRGMTVEEIFAALIEPPAPERVEAASQRLVSHWYR
ncbi:hypothetical protein BS47DRAFT_848933 [Hydnum rufescens UP504]|uniref:Uncharacterized protein n=1 Tax=Hydnum rufescens UP504 TaxID=1448309 RepID=A0A9P6E203_9AGAM|nr:hypothetical protein BS47DRAFT_848933 [Hydnum rufescens UP504]